ncbi:extracellular solute-binding protein [Moraxella macacae]|nr:extracellular solute-binding protein [Moraxella macacae]
MQPSKKSPKFAFVVLSVGIPRLVILSVLAITSVLTEAANAPPLTKTPLYAKNQTGYKTVTALAHNSTPAFVELKHLPYANPNAPKGGVLSLSAQGTFNSLNPWYDNGTPVVGTTYLYDTLMTGSLSESFVMYPQLAQKVTFDPNDKSWVIYHINPHAKFWDGSPVTAHDVKASINAIVTKGVMSMRSYLAGIKDIQVLDKHRVKFIFDGADNAELLLTVGQMPVWKKQSIDESFEKVSLTPLMGSGAYQVGRVDAGRSISYVRDPNYWGAKPESGVMANVGRFNFDTIKFVYYQNPEVAFEGFKAGEYQFRVENKARTWVKGYQFLAVNNGMIKKQSIDNHNPVPAQVLVMNNRLALFNDIRVRQALTLAYDFAWLNRTMFYGQYRRLTSFFYGSQLQATGLPTPDEKQILQPLLAKLDPIARKYVMIDWQSEQSPFYQSQADGFNRDRLLQARSLLLQAGFFYKDGRLYQKNGKLASFQILVHDDNQTRIILPYVRNLRRLGFGVEIRNADLPQYLQRVRKFDYDMIVDIFAQSLSPGAEQSYLWGSKAADEPGNQNTAGIKNPAIDSVIDKLIKSHNRDEIVLYTKVLDRLLLANFYVIPTYGKATDTVAYWQQFEHAKLPTNALGIDYWWVNAEKEKAVKAYLGK